MTPYSMKCSTIQSILGHMEKKEQQLNLGQMLFNKKKGQFNESDFCFMKKVLIKMILFE